MMESRNPEIHIPMELWFNILSFLPVETLLRFRAVSKSFLALIDDPNFVSFHLRSFPANRHETHLFVTTQENFQIHETTIASTTSKSIDSMETGFPDSYGFVRGSIDGLFLLSNGDVRFNLSGGGLLLCNPSTRKKRWLPFPSWFSEHAIHSALLCHDHLRRDYNVLLLQCQYITLGHTCTQLGLYSVSKDSWKTLDSGVFGVSWRNLPSGVSFSGGVAWVEFDFGKDHQRRHLVLFDFGTETTERYAALPCSSSARYYNLFRVNGGRGLGLEADGQVWELEMEKMTWTSMYKIGSELTPFNLRLLAARKENGELVLSTWRGGSIKVWLYNTKTMEIENYEEVPEKAHDVRVHVESLVKL